MLPRFDCRLEREARTIALFEQAKNPLDAADKEIKKMEIKFGTGPKPVEENQDDKTEVGKKKLEKGDLSNAEKNPEEEKPITKKDLADVIGKQKSGRIERADAGLQKQTEQVAAVDQKVAKMKTPDENRKETIDHRAAVKRADLFVPIGKDTEVVDASGAKEEDVSKPKAQSMNDSTPKQEAAQAPKQDAPDKVASANAAKTEQLVQKQTPKPKVESPEAMNVERENT